MPFKRIVKIQSINQMLMNYFLGKSDFALTSTIHNNVCSEVVAEALNDKLIELEFRDGNSYYHLTQKGKEKLK